MNKIYNNLSIENLTKTEWFNQFDHNQKLEILRGLKENLDVSIYAKSDFDWRQMNEILEGLKNNIDVSIYAKKEFNDEQMNEIRLGLKNNSDVSIYVNKYIVWKQMNKINLALEKETINVLIYCAKIKYYLNKIKGKLSKKERN